MKSSIWYIIIVTVIIAMGFGGWYMLQGGAEIQTSVSVSKAMASGDQKGYLRVKGPRDFSFPEDHGPHPGYKTEWWYFTGNLFTDDGRQFGYQFTIFRNQLNPPAARPDHTDSVSNWTTNQLYLGHFALSDVKNKNHIFEERSSRGAVGLAGSQADPLRIWIDDWEIRQTGDQKVDAKHFSVHLKAAMTNGASVNFHLKPTKPLVLEGDRGYDRKGLKKGNASYYLSFTRMKTKGVLKLRETQFNVAGTSWMDHEWSTSALNKNEEGWDWFSIQLSNGYDLMYYQLRNKDGSVSKFTTGSMVRPNGKKTTIGPGDVTIKVLDKWKSPHNKAIYPSKWTINIPTFNVSLDLKTLIPDQEMDVSVRYYEGTIAVSGSMMGNDISGTGFIEMTGY